MAFQASTVAHSKAAGSWIKTDSFAFLPDQYRLGSVSTGKPHVRPQLLPRCMPSGETPRAVRKAYARRILPQAAILRQWN